MIEPIRIEFDVACPADHAFEVWTGRIGQWWPADHTASGEADTTVMLEGRPGGRIFERTSTGIEHDWGEVTVWEPPARFGYLWHLRRDRADATEVEVRFVDRGDATTRVEIEHRGWEALGAEGESWRDRNHGGWATLLPYFVAFTHGEHRASNRAVASARSVPVNESPRKPLAADRFGLPAAPSTPVVRPK